MAPENTLAAFRYAMEHGADGMETDIHLTADHVLVCCHDCNTKYVFGEDNVIEKHVFADLANLKARPHNDAYPSEGLPSFADALKVLRPGKYFYVEIKDYDTAVIDEMVKQVKLAGKPDKQIVIISFHAAMVKYAKEKYPQYKALWLTGFPKNEQGEYSQSLDELVKLLVEIKADGIDCSGNFEYMTEDFYRTLKDAGMKIVVWTIDNPVDVQRFLDEGADGITSNRASSLVNECRY